MTIITVIAVVLLFIYAAWKHGMNGIFFLMVAVSFGVAAYRELRGEFTDKTPMQLLSDEMINSAAGSVELAIGLIGVMTLFLGLMSVVEAGGMLTILAKLIRPLLTRLFPEVPVNHPAMGAMIMNMSANALGLANAATPFGIKAMEALDKLNPHKGTATNSMALFLAINTSSVTLLPTGIIALRASAGSANAAGIFVPTLFATICSTTVAIVACKFYARFSPSPAADPDFVPPAVSSATEDEASYPMWVSVTAIACVVGLIPIALFARPFVMAASPWILPLLMVSMLGFGVARRVPVYEVFVEGARDGFQVAVKIIPYLVAILVAVGLLRGSGALEIFVSVIGPYTASFGLPADALPMALLRPLSGSGAYGIVASIISDPNIGPDSYVGYLVSTLQGSTETTFYVLAVYFGAVRIKNIRHAMAGALTADVAGIIGAVVGCQLFL